MLLSWEMDTATRIQILGETVSISHRKRCKSNSYEKTLGQTGLFNLGMCCIAARTTLLPVSRSIKDTVSREGVKRDRSRSLNRRALKDVGHRRPTSDVTPTARDL